MEANEYSHLSSAIGMATQVRLNTTDLNKPPLLFLKDKKFLT